LTSRPDFVVGANQRVAPPPHLRRWFLAVQLGLVALHAGPVAAQQEAGAPSTVPLPTIVYPSRIAKPASPDSGRPTVVPESTCSPDGDCQIRYVLVGGVWGYWDRSRHFHRASAATAHTLRSGAVAYRAPIATHTASIAHERVHR